MADSVNRIVPPSVSLDRSSAIGRERENKSRGEAPRQKPPPPPAEGTEAEKDSADSGEEKIKGNILDINV
jgi:hypothetical protein